MNNFIKNASKNDFLSSLEENIIKVANQEKSEIIQKKQDRMVLLAYAAGLLDEAGLEKEAILTTQLMEKLAWDLESDPATKGLTPEKMEQNLKEKGWVFNADDGTDSKASSAEVDDETKANDGDILVVHDPESGETKDFEDKDDTVY